MTVECLISLGANLGDRAETIRRALEKLSDPPEVTVRRASRLYETRPVGGPPGQPGFLNAAAVLETSLPPAELLAVLLHTEAALGRMRGLRWAPRPIDLDLLLYGEAVLTTPSLMLPHPRMAWRRFVLEPAAEIAPDMRHPTTGWTIAGLLGHLRGTPYYLAMTGSIAAGKTELAGRVTGQMGARGVYEKIDKEQLAAFYANPASQAWSLELEFLQQRARLLSDRAEFWQDRSTPVMSDFWFDQSAAFVGVWLAPGQYARFVERFEFARKRVARPRLVVFLQSSGEQLRERLLRRGRACERGLTATDLERIQQAIDRQTRQPDVGPVLRIGGDDLETAFEEVAAALGAMK